MTRSRTALDYSRRIDRVIAHIADHLDETLELPDLAQIASFSPYHFHRIYRSITGETVADTLRRLRLHRAAGDLVMGTLAVAAIARRAGYGSVAAFTRSFGAVYGVTPARYRQQGRLVMPDASTSNPELPMQSVTIADRSPIRLAALPHQGSYMEIGATFDRLMAWAAPRGLLGPGTRSFGIYYDDPNAVPAAKLHSEATLSIPDDMTKVDAPARIVDLAGGRHAVLRHKGPYAELENAYRWLYKEWLPQSGEEPADRPCFEEYLNNPRDLPPAEWLTDICLPLAPR
ncbi:MAG: AraC family transcriptional regulator [Rhodospirillales bacterium]|nr:AraC family transcriptional regulator [Rhodospirillales bacterium]